MAGLDYLFVNAFVITMQGKGIGILEEGAVGVKGSRIVVVGPTDEVLRDFHTDQLIDASGKVLMPGLIDAHIHTGDGLIRGVAQDLQLDAARNLAF